MYVYTTSRNYIYLTYMEDKMSLKVPPYLQSWIFYALKYTKFVEKHIRKQCGLANNKFRALCRRLRPRFGVIPQFRIMASLHIWTLFEYNSISLRNIIDCLLYSFLYNVKALIFVLENKWKKKKYLTTFFHYYTKAVAV